MAGAAGCLYKYILIFVFIKIAKYFYKNEVIEVYFILKKDKIDSLYAFFKQKMKKSGSI
jgi:hypothetical protein